MTDHHSPAACAAPPADGSAPHVAVDFPRCIARAFPDSFPLAWDAVARSLAAIEGRDLTALAARSPALAGFDWPVYLRCSVARMVRALDALRAEVPLPARVLDAGAYLGNFSLMLATAGYHVDAADTYSAYGEGLAGVRDAMAAAGVTIIDTAAATGGSLGGPYDAILAMGVIEHIPHTPRPWIEALDRALRPGGLLILDTPNLGYLYTRQRLMRGESIFCPIALQYGTDLPFEGHHREYTLDEIRWIVGAIGHEPVELSTFNYSVYGLDVLHGIDLENHRRMDADPGLRELVFSVSRKPCAL